jgi:serine/threonine protein kinase
MVDLYDIFSLLQAHLSTSKYTFEGTEPVSEGAESWIWKAHDEARTYAIKVFKEPSEIIPLSISMLKKITHPSIVKCFTNFSILNNHNTYQCAVLEWFSGEPISNYFGAIKQVRTETKKAFICDIADALLHMADHLEEHTDLHEGNILVGIGLNLKIIDPGVQSSENINPFNITQYNRSIIKNIIRNIFSLAERETFEEDWTTFHELKTHFSKDYQELLEIRFSKYSTRKVEKEYAKRKYEKIPELHIFLLPHRIVEKITKDQVNAHFRPINMQCKHAQKGFIIYDSRDTKTPFNYFIHARGWIEIGLSTYSRAAPIYHWNYISAMLNSKGFQSFLTSASHLFGLNYLLEIIPNNKRASFLLEGIIDKWKEAQGSERVFNEYKYANELKLEPAPIITRDLNIEHPWYSIIEELGDKIFEFFGHSISDQYPPSVMIPPPEWVRQMLNASEVFKSL